MKKLIEILEQTQNEPEWFWYLKEVCTEELFFRLVLCWAVAQVVPGWVAVLFSSVVYGLAHFILFRWPMVVVSGLLGIPLGILFLWLADFGTRWWLVLAMLTVSVVHYACGAFCASIGWTEKWIKRDKKTNKFLKVLKIRRELW